MNDAELATSGDRNLALAWAMLGRAAGWDVVESGPLILVASGIPAAFFNGAFLSAPTNEAERLVAEAVQFYSDRNLPWLLWVRDTLCPSMLEAGRAIGLTNAGGPPAIALAPIPQAPSPPAELTIEIARSVEALVDHAAMLRDGFGIPRDVVDRMIQPALLEVAAAAVFVGRVDGEPVSCSLLATSDATAGIYNVATPERCRGKGYGEALTWAAVSEGASRGCTHAVLQSSEAGYPIYRRMGFADLGRYVQLAGPPGSSAPPTTSG